MAYNWLLPGGTSAQLVFQGQAPTPKAIERLVNYLDFLKADLQEEPEAKDDEGGE